MKKTFGTLLLAAAFAVGATSIASADPAAREWGTIVDSSSGLPDINFTSYIVYEAGDDSQIHTEWGVDPTVGDSGLSIQSGTMYYFAAVDQLRVGNGLEDGDQFEVEVVYDDGTTQEKASVTGTGDDEYNATASPRPGFALNLAAATLPAKPVVTGDYNTSFNEITLDWTGESGVTYDVYISENPSGASNGRGNGIYYKIADGVTPPYSFDEFTVPYFNSGASPKPVNNNNITYYFTVIGVDGSDEKGAHSDEISVTTVFVAPPLPTMTFWGVVSLMLILSMGLVYHKQNGDELS